MTTSIRAKKHVFAIDCPDAMRLGRFYADLLGWRLDADEDGTWVDVVPPEGDGAGYAIACQQIEHYRMPEWPDGQIPQQAHLDLYVDSIAEAAAVAEALGATRHEHQPSRDGGFLVLLDPAGHPFCLCDGSE